MVFHYWRGYTYDKDESHDQDFQSTRGTPQAPTSCGEQTHPPDAVTSAFHGPLPASAFPYVQIRIESEHPSQHLCAGFRLDLDRYSNYTRSRLTIADASRQCVQEMPPSTRLGVIPSDLARFAQEQKWIANRFLLVGHARIAPEIQRAF